MKTPKIDQITTSQSSHFPFREWRRLEWSDLLVGKINRNDIPDGQRSTVP